MKKTRDDSVPQKPSFLNDISASPRVDFKSPFMVIPGKSSTCGNVDVQLELQHQPILLLFHGYNGDAHVREFE